MPREESLALAFFGRMRKGPVGLCALIGLRAGRLHCLPQQFRFKQILEAFFVI
jgi:hypothetical protein